MSFANAAKKMQREYAKHRQEKARKYRARKIAKPVTDTWPRQVSNGAVS